MRAERSWIRSRFPAVPNRCNKVGDAIQSRRGVWKTVAPEDKRPVIEGGRSGWRTSGRGKPGCKSFEASWTRGSRGDERLGRRKPKIEHRKSGKRNGVEIPRAGKWHEETVADPRHRTRAGCDPRLRQRRDGAIGSEGWTSAGDGDGGGSRRLKRGISKRKANEREVRDERATREGDDDGPGGR